MSGPTFPPEYAHAYIGNRLLDFTSAMIGILICFVALRYIARFVSKTPIGADDYLTIPSIISSLALCGVSIGEISSQ